MSDNEQAKKEDLKWGLKQRLIFIEATVFWGGRLTTNMLADAFGVARRQAGKDIALYEVLAPNNIFHDRGKRGYVPTTAFKPIFIKGDSSEYFNWLQASLADSGRLLSFPIQFGSAEALPIPRPIMKPEFIKNIVDSIRKNKAITLYIGNRNSGCYVTPHTIIYDGYDWFVRVINHVAQQFETISMFDVLHVDSDIPAGYYGLLSSESSKKSLENDVDWNQIESVQYLINPKFSSIEKKEIERLYQIINNRLTINIRTALVDMLHAKIMTIRHNDLPVFIQLNDHDHTDQ